MAARQKTPSNPQVLRIEAMPLGFGEAAVVIELATEPPKRWFKALKREMMYSEGLETASAKFDGCFVYLVGLDPALGSAVRCASRLLAAVQEGDGSERSTRGDEQHGLTCVSGRASSREGSTRRPCSNRRWMSEARQTGSGTDEVYGFIVVRSHAAPGACEAPEVSRASTSRPGPTPGAVMWRTATDQRDRH